ncbi:MAG TPA: ATP-binding protein [Mucilaginibacter sp.]|jgi:hypothetical protein|nr:ATP-binding protein [Mucilaginibacter sp.]
MKLTQNDIGGEIISIITKGMYADPKDALREYVQNGVDAGAEKIEIRIRGDKIVLQDYGTGMTKGSMRRAVRVGMSDKNPKLSVGFMGIGLYSSFHLCDKLVIHSKVDGHEPNQLIFNFKQMRDVLDEQKEARILKLNVDEEGASQVALLPLLEDHVEFTALTNADYPTVGTRVEMSGVEENFFMSLSKFEEVSDYLEKVVPLPFHPEFTPGKEIQEYIDEQCKERGAIFRIITLNLDINGRKEDLYRPYKDSDFLPSKPSKPVFKILQSDTEFYGVSWGVLNASNNVIPNAKVRGFLLRKQGFALGVRDNLLAKFGAKFFNRYVGEIIVVHPQLLPNGARNDFEYSNLRTSFYRVLEDTAEEFNDDANDYQEQEKAEVELVKLIDLYRETRSQLRFFESNSDKLLDVYKTISTEYNKFKKRMEAGGGKVETGGGWKIRTSIKAEALTTMKLLDDLIVEIKNLIEVKKEAKKKKPATITETAAILSQAPASREQPNVEKIPSSLADVVELIGYEFSKDIKQIFDLLEQKYIRPTTATEEDFINELISLKNEIEDINNDEF